MNVAGGGAGRSSKQIVRSRQRLLSSFSPIHMPFIFTDNTCIILGLCTVFLPVGSHSCISLSGYIVSRTGVDAKNMKYRRRKGQRAKPMSKLARACAVEPQMLALTLP